MRAFGISRLVGTLRGQLALGYILILATVLVVVGTFQYSALRAFLVHHSTTSLRTEIRAAWQTVYTPEVDPRLRAMRLAQALASPRRMVWVYDARLREEARAGLALRRDAGQAINPPFRVLAALSAGRVYPPTLWTHNGSQWLVVVQSLGLQGAPAIVVAESFHDGSAILAQLAWKNLTGGGVALIAAILLGLLLVNRALRPLGRVVEVSERISQGDFGQRVETKGSTGEVLKVGQALNQMLRSVEAALSAERLAQQRIRRFVADAAHELRTPITAINGFLEVLHNQPKLDQATLTHSLTVMRAEGQRLARMIGQLLDLARLDRQADLTVAPVELNALLTGLWPVLEVLVGDHPLGSERTSETLPIRADADALKQVVWNLVDNAARYSPPESPIEIATAREGDRAILRICDRGPGIPAEELPHIFDRFYRGNEVKSQPGTGLGLAIVGSIIEAHGGEIELVPRDGGGTEARVTFGLDERGDGPG